MTSRGTLRLLVILGTLPALSTPVDAAEPAAKVDALGDPQPEGVLLRIGSTRLRHAGSVTALVFSPDGQYLASGGADNAVRLWNTSTGKQVLTKTGDDVQALDFTADGKTLASSSGYGVVRLWDVATGRQLRELPGHASAGATQTQAIRFSPDGKHLSLADREGRIILREVAGGKALNTFHVGLDHWFRVGFSPDGRLAASCAGDHVVHISDVARGKELLKLPAHKDHVYAAVFSPDGRYLATGGRSNHLHLWELATGQLICTLPSNDHVLAFSPDGRTLASGGHFTKLSLWDLVKGKEFRVLDQALRRIEVLAFSPDGRLLAAGSHDGVIRLWDSATGQEKLAGAEGGKPVAFLAGGRELVLDSASGMVFYDLLSPAHGAPRWSVREHRRLEGVHGLLAADGKTVTASRSYRGIDVWDVARKIELHKFDERGDDSGFAYAPDGKTLAVAGWRGINLFDIASGKSLRRLEGHKARSVGLAFSPDGKSLVSAGSEGDNSLRFWDPATGKEVRHVAIPAERDHDRYPPTLVFSPGGRTLAIGGRYRGTQLWDVASATRVLDLKISGPIAFSPDGKLLATGGQTSVVQLWELATGKPLAELRGHEGPVTALLFAPDSHVLASGSSDHTTLLWDVRLQRLFAPPGQAAKPEEAERKQCWTALGEPGPVAAYQALARLVSDPAGSVTFLTAHLQPAAALPPAQIQQLLADLNATEFPRREQASAALRKLGPIAEGSLREALKGNPTLEQLRRVERVLAELGSDEVALPAGDRLRGHRAIQLLEIIGTAQARAALQRLADGVPLAPQTQNARAALERLKRLDRAR